MIRQVLRWITGKMSNPRVIYDMMGESPYLSRYYILGRPRMADGSDPFDRFGNPHPETIWPSCPPKPAFWVSSVKVPFPLL